MVNQCGKKTIKIHGFLIGWGFFQFLDCLKKVTDLNVLCFIGQIACKFV